MRNERLLRLGRIYALYDTVGQELEMHCGKGCAGCCTNQVTLTTLEAQMILSHLKFQDQPLPLAALAEAARGHCYRPSMTTNQFADRCAKGMDGPDEAADPCGGVCPLLEDDLCSIYGARPFGCRAMQSVSDCRRGGAAEMPEWLLSANILFLQVIEALDTPGLFGGLCDILLFMSVTEQRAAYERGAAVLPGVPANRSIPVLMVPPQDQRRLQGILRELQRILQGSE